VSADDQLVADYLNRLAAAASRLPADRRAELFEEISLHIAEARVVLAAGAAAPTAGNAPPTAGAAAPTAVAAAPTAVADLLAQLGRPEDIVRAAAEDSEDPDAVTELLPASGHAPSSYSASSPRQHGRGRRALDIGTVVLLLIGGLLLGLGWIVGVVMLWTSPRWRTADKLLGTLVWPGGLAAVLVVLRFGADLPALLALSLLLIGVCGPIYTAIRLLKHAGRTPPQPAAEPAALQPV